MPAAAVMPERIGTRRCGRGQAMVEFLIVLPVLLLLVLGILQFAQIYKAKITLNYAAFETARSGSLNHARKTAMEAAFARSMAPLYTNRYTRFSGGNCHNDFTLLAGSSSRRVLDGGYSAAAGGGGSVLNSDDYICAKRRVEQQIADGYVNITVVNPSFQSFADHGIVIEGEMLIPNDNLMYRDATVQSSSVQSIQDANLLKVHVGYCYELLVPFVNRIVWSMQRYGPGSVPSDEAMYGRRWAGTGSPPGQFGPPRGGSFAEKCVSNPKHGGRYSIVLYSQGIMRMHTPAKQAAIAGS
jgi:Flp pilus assembly protein TadG